MLCISKGRKKNNFSPTWPEKCGVEGGPVWQTWSRESFLAFPAFPERVVISHCRTGFRHLNTNICFWEIWTVLRDKSGKRETNLSESACRARARAVQQAPQLAHSVSGYKLFIPHFTPIALFTQSQHKCTFLKEQVIIFHLYFRQGCTNTTDNSVIMSDRRPGSRGKVLSISLLNVRNNCLTQRSHNKRGKLQSPHCLIWTDQTCYWEMKVQQLPGRKRGENYLQAPTLQSTPRWNKNNRVSDFKDMREHKVLSLQAWHVASAAYSCNGNTTSAWAWLFL